MGEFEDFTNTQTAKDWGFKVMSCKQLVWHIQPHQVIYKPSQALSSTYMGVSKEWRN